MLTIKCAKCNKKILKYEKLGQGRILRCYISKIKEIYGERVDDELQCRCGTVIGIYENRWIKMKQHIFSCSGTKINK